MNKKWGLHYITYRAFFWVAICVYFVLSPVFYYYGNTINYFYRTDAHNMSFKNIILWKNPIPSCHPYQQICGPLWECPYWGSCSLPWVGRPGKSSPHRYDLAAEMLLAETKISELWNLLINITVFSLKQTKTSSKTYCGTYVADFYNPIIQAFQLVQLCILHNPAGTWLGNDFFLTELIIELFIAFVISFDIHFMQKCIGIQLYQPKSIPLCFEFSDKSQVCFSNYSLRNPFG